jgi:hypothetical protein
MQSKLFHGYNYFKDIVYSKEYLDLKRESDRYFSRLISGHQSILKGDIVKISQIGFTDNLTLDVLFDNTEDVFGQQCVIVTVPQNLITEYFTPKSNVYIEAVVEFLDKNTLTGYPQVKMVKWLEMNDTLLFPHYICPSCGKDYGTSKGIADFPERQYCDLCAGIEESDLVRIYNRNDYNTKIKHHIDLG